MCKLLSGIALIGVFAVPAAAQTTSWIKQQTAHFDLHYQSPQRPEVSAIAATAEDAYRRISAAFEHDLSDRMPLIILDRDSDLPRTSSEAAALVTSSGASLFDHLFTSIETFSRRPSSIGHELTHQFLFELLPSDDNAPWLPEALCDHYSGAWEPSQIAALRDARARTGIPAIETLTAADRDWGRVVFDFMGTRFGAAGIRQYLRVVRDTPSTSPAAVTNALGVSSADFNRAFREFAAARLAP